MPESWNIIGVIKDMVMESPYEPVKQMFYFLDFKYEAASRINIKLKPGVSSKHGLSKH